MSKFKAGDLALIIGATQNFNVIGLAVELTEPTINTSGEPGWRWVGGTARFGSLERHLMPLRGDFEPERQKQQEQPA